MATRGRKSAKAPTKDNLLAALEFVQNAQRNIGTALQTHCIIKDGWCVASDNVLTMGCKVLEDFAGCPQTSRLIATLRRCGETVSFTQLDTDRISVKSGSLRVVIPCVAPESLAILWADPQQAPLGAAFTDGCRVIGHLASDGGVAAHLASLLGRGQTLTATTGRVLVEYWHGFNTPDYWVLPKPAVTALLKVNKTLTGLGYSGNSATFHFEDESWLKTQLFEDKWPNVDKLFEQTSAGELAPENLFTSIDVLSEFAEPGAHIRFKNDMLELAAKESEHAEYEVKGLREGSCFGLKDMQQISKMVKTFDYRESERHAAFSNDRLRGAIAKVTDVL